MPSTECHCLAPRLSPEKSLAYEVTDGRTIEGSYTTKITTVAFMTFFTRNMCNIYLTYRMYYLENREACFRGRVYSYYASI